MNSVRRLGLGTVQFGLPYGVSNRAGRTPPREVKHILDFADAHGVQLLDTAPAYGSAEAVLGKLLPERHSFRIVTKVLLRPENNLETVSVEGVVRSSLKAMKAKSVYGVLLHDGSILAGPAGDECWESLLRLKDMGLTEKVGASVYSPEEAEFIIERYSVDIMQIPVNVLDQRFIKQGCVLKMNKKGIEIHARSCFLQGLMLMEPDDLPPFFEPVRGLLRKFKQSCIELGLSRIGALLDFVLSVQELRSIIVGVNSLPHLKEIVEAVKKSSLRETMDFKDFSVDNPEMVEPRFWP